MCRGGSKHLDREIRFLFVFLLTVGATTVNQKRKRIKDHESVSRFREYRFEELIESEGRKKEGRRKTNAKRLFTVWQRCAKESMSFPRDGNEMDRVRVILGDDKDG